MVFLYPKEREREKERARARARESERGRKSKREREREREQKCGRLYVFLNRPGQNEKSGKFRKERYIVCN